MRFPARLVLVLPILLHLGAATGIRGQTPAQSTASMALIEYSLERKSEWAALGLEWLVPVVGHAYAGNAMRGVLPAVVTVGGMVALIQGAGCDSLCAVNGRDRNNDDLAWIGLGAVAVGRIWGMVSAHQTASDHNSELRSRLGITATGHAGRPELRVTLRI